MKPWNDSNLPVGERATALLQELSLEERVAQLGSFWPSRVADEQPADDGQGRDVAPMESEFAKSRQEWADAHRSGLGHLTRNFGTNPVSVPEGVGLLRQRQADVVASSRFGIPALAHEECLTGFTALGATVYPAAIAWGATWRPELVAEMAAAIGADMRAVGIHQGLSPLLDVVRDYRWGRTEETCGEDPYLVGTLGTAYVKGLQSSGVDATLKHFVGYPAGRAGRNHAPLSMGRRELEDVMLYPFEMAVREGQAASVMNSYSDIDGEVPGASRWLLTEVLRGRWGFDGTVVSDYWAVNFLTSTHRIAPDEATAAALAIRAGLDIELPNTGSYAYVSEALDRGMLTQEEFDTAVLRALEQKIRLGLLDPEWDAEADADPERDLDSAHNRDVARRMAQESVILLRNEGILPLAADAGKVALIGPSWQDARSYMGCYSFANHVMARFPGNQTGLEIRGLDDALASALGTELLLAEGCGFTDGTDEQLAEAVRAATEADVAVLTVGDIAGLFGIGTSGEGCDVADLNLPGRQGELVEAVLGTGTPTILVLVTGRPYALGAYAERTAAIIQAFMPGVEGSEAIAGVITGELNPSGRLPIGIPNNHGGQPGTYLAPSLAWHSDGISNLDPRPLYPFGHGLSYTSFELSEPALSASTMPTDGSLSYEVSVTNTGQRDGSHVVQLYLEDPWAEVVRPLKQLIGFVKVDLAAGQSARVHFDVHADRTSFTGLDYQRIVEPGEILLSAGSSSEDRLDALSVEITGSRRVVPEGRVLTTPVTLT